MQAICATFPFTDGDEYKTTIVELCSTGIRTDETEGNKTAVYVEAFDEVDSTNNYARCAQQTSPVTDYQGDYLTVKMCDNGCGSYSKTGGQNAGDYGETCEEVSSKDPTADFECYQSPYFAFTPYNDTITVEMCTNNCTNIISASRTTEDEVAHRECGTIYEEPTNSTYCTFLQSPPSDDVNEVSYNMTYCSNGCVTTQGSDGFYESWCHEESNIPVTCTNLPWMGTDGDKILVEVCSDGCSTMKSVNANGTESVEG